MHSAAGRIDVEERNKTCSLDIHAYNTGKEGAIQTVNDIFVSCVVNLL